MTDVEREAEIREYYKLSGYAKVQTNTPALLRLLDELRQRTGEYGAKASELAIKLNEARAEIARLDKLLKQSNFDLCEEHAGRMAAVNEIARLCAPPEADVIEQARHLFNAAHYCGSTNRQSVTESIARALTAAKREATDAERSRCALIDGVDLAGVRREARAAAIEEAAQVAETDHETLPCPTHYSAEVARVRAQRIAANIRALTEPKP